MDDDSKRKEAEVEAEIKAEDDKAEEAIQVIKKLDFFFHS